LHNLSLHLKVIHIYTSILSQFTRFCAIIINNTSHIILNICKMQHRGEIIKKAVYKSGFSITELAKRLGKSRRWVYLMFENPSVSLDVVLQLEKIIHYNFSKEIKEIRPSNIEFIESISGNQTEKYSEEYWKNKYLRLLEEYNDLLKINNSK
jgi:hypothetical protein